MGYVAIRHFDCNDQWFLCVDDVTIVEGETQSTDGGNFNHGETCVVTATPNTDYHFVNWTENGSVVSSDATYSFTVTGDRDLVANFSNAPTTTEQTVTLSAGWSWWSTYVDMDGAAMLNQMKQAMSVAGSSITSKSNGFASYVNGLGWTGTLSAIDPAQMYKIKAVGNVSFTLDGAAIDPTQLPITLKKNSNWIGFPVTQNMSVADAFANANPVNGDKVSSLTQYAEYYNGAWSGTLNTLEPGHGYVYNSKANATKTFTYPAVTRTATKPNVSAADNYWVPVYGQYSDVMCITVNAYLDGVALNDESVEVAAFVDGECRGSAKLMYVESADAYVAFLNVVGTEDETLSFKLLNDGESYVAEEQVTMQLEGMLGRIDSPYGIHANTRDAVSLFPNPVAKDAPIRLQVTSKVNLTNARVEVYNAMGVMVRSEQLGQAETELSGLATAGIYTVKVYDNNGNAYYSRLIVR